jgi:hypothetical protein
MKVYIRCHGSRSRAAVESGDKAVPFMFLYETLNAITSQDAHQQTRRLWCSGLVLLFWLGKI